MISVIIPAYNEERTIGELIDRIRISLKGRKYEIIIVDDCSSDRTYEIAKSKKAKIIRHKKRTSGNIFPALEKIKGDVIAKIDADLENDPYDLPKMIKQLEENNFDLVLGSRPKFSRKAEYLINLFYKFPVKDIFTGYIVFSRKLLPMILKYKMKLWIEFPIYAIKNNFKVGEVNVKFKRRKDKARFGGEIIGGLKTIRHFIESERRNSRIPK